jgi:hypothetical protein
MIRVEHNVETGVIKEVTMTAKEVKDLEAVAAELAANKAAAQLKAEAKAALLERLGITADEAALLLS